MAFFAADAFTLWLWLVLRMMETIDAHSGYRFPFSPFSYKSVSERHDFHHSNNRGNFGVTAFWDWLTGTDKAYNEWHRRKLTGGIGAAASTNDDLADGYSVEL
jgi:sterol desaturase/sphingolipid hydroxylase (fatty acid hydroxylase superfamily)